MVIWLLIWFRIEILSWMQRWLVLVGHRSAWQVRVLSFIYSFIPNMVKSVTCDCHHWIQLKILIKMHIRCQYYLIWLDCESHDTTHGIVCIYLISLIFLKFSWFFIIFWKSFKNHFIFAHPPMLGWLCNSLPTFLSLCNIFQIIQLVWSIMPLLVNEPFSQFIDCKFDWVWILSPLDLEPPPSPIITEISVFCQFLVTMAIKTVFCPIIECVGSGKHHISSISVYISLLGHNMPIWAIFAIIFGFLGVLTYFF